MTTDTMFQPYAYQGVAELRALPACESEIEAMDALHAYHHGQREQHAIEPGTTQEDLDAFSQAYWADSKIVEVQS